MTEHVKPAGWIEDPEIAHRVALAGKKERDIDWKRRNQKDTKTGLTERVTSLLGKPDNIAQAKERENSVLERIDEFEQLRTSPIAVSFLNFVTQRAEEFDIPHVADAFHNTKTLSAVELYDSSVAAGPEKQPPLSKVVTELAILVSKDEGATRNIPVTAGNRTPTEDTAEDEKLGIANDADLVLIQDLYTVLGHSEAIREIPDLPMSILPAEAGSTQFPFHEFGLKLDFRYQRPHVTIRKEGAHKAEPPHVILKAEKLPDEPVQLVDTSILDEPDLSENSSLTVRNEQTDPRPHREKRKGK